MSDIVHNRSVLPITDTHVFETMDFSFYEYLVVMRKEIGYSTLISYSLDVKRANNGVKWFSELMDIATIVITLRYDEV